jgi:hypothetical protein
MHEKCVDFMKVNEGIELKNIRHILPAPQMHV